MRIRTCLCGCLQPGLQVGKVFEHSRHYFFRLGMSRNFVVEIGSAIMRYSFFTE